MHARRLTISSRYPEIRARRSEYVGAVPMPLLRLQGYWLDQAGFPIGAQVRVEVVDCGSLVVEGIDAAVTPQRWAARYATHPSRGHRAPETNYRVPERHALGLHHPVDHGATISVARLAKRAASCLSRTITRLLVADSGTAPAKRSTVKKLAMPLEREAEDAKLTVQVVDYYHQTLLQSPGY